MKEELFQVKLGMWLEVNICNVWVICQVIDISDSGRVVWVETHEDSYRVDRLENRLRKLQE